jgi:hypothetical protein
MSGSYSFIPSSSGFGHTGGGGGWGSNKGKTRDKFDTWDDGNEDFDRPRKNKDSKPADSSGRKVFQFLDE